MEASETQMEESTQENSFTESNESQGAKPGSGGLILSTDNVTGENTTYVSVLDLYGVDCFSDKTVQMQERLKMEAEEETKQLINQMFTDANRSQREEEHLQNLLFTQQTTVLKKIDYSVNDTSSAFSYFFFIGSAVVLFCCGILGYYQKRKRRRQQDVNNINDYDSGYGR